MAKGKTPRSSNSKGLFVKGIVLGYRRSQRNQVTSISLLKVEGVESMADVSYYLGKRVAYVYRAKKATEQNPSRVRVIWGKIVKHHGNRGVVRARFTSNLPPKTFGASCRVMLYPNRV